MAEDQAREDLGYSTTNIDVEPQPVQGFTPGGEFSYVDVFKEELRELSETQEVYVPVKGYEKTGLQIKYHMPEHGKELGLIAQRVMRETKDVFTRNLYIAMDTMSHLCDGLYVQPEGVEEPVMLDPQELGEPMQFDERLAEMMGANGEVSSSRQVIRKLFGGNDLAVVNHAERLQRWLANTKADLDAELWQLGE